MFKNNIWQNIVFCVLLIAAGWFIAHYMWASDKLYSAHDVDAHLVRLIAYDNAFRDGQFPPRWAPELFNGLGSPVLILNYQLPYFLAEFFLLLGYDHFWAFKAVLTFSFIASGVAMYFAACKLYGKLAGFVAGFLYMWAPYRVVDLYVRGAFGEAFSFLFPPLILLALATGNIFFGSLMFAGLFLSHPVSSAFFCGFFFFWQLLQSWLNASWHPFRQFLIMFGFGFVIAAFNLIPTLALTKATHYSPNNSNPYMQFPTMGQLLGNSWGFGSSTPDQNDGMSFQIGYVQLIVIDLALLTLIFAWIYLKRPIFSKKYAASLYIVAAVLLAIFFMIESSAPLWRIIHLENIIDFPWRILIFVVFGVSLLSAWLIGKLSAVSRVSLLLSLLIISFYCYHDYIGVSRWLPNNPAYYQKGNNTGDAYGEYASRARKTWDTTYFEKKVESISGALNITDLEKRTDRVSFNTSASQSATVRINTMFFPGWQVTIDGDRHVPTFDSKPCYITKKESTYQDDSGLIACRLSAGNHQVQAIFTKNPIEIWSYILSAGGMIVLICWRFLLFFRPSMRRVTSKNSSKKSVKS